MATTDHPEFVDTAAQPEKRGIELIDPADRHGRARDLFAVWAAPSVSVLNLTVGASLTLLGLELWQTALVILAASLLWIFPGLVAVSGPSAGTSSSVIQRAIYGIRGNKIVIAFYGWFISGVFLALNWVASSFMGAELLTRMGMENRTLAAVLVTLVVSVITVLVAIYGHGLILRAYNYVAGLLVVIFLVVAAFILPQAQLGYVQDEPLHGVALWSAVSIGFAILASAPLSFSNSSDMSRYLPVNTKPGAIVAATALGGAIPAALFSMVGATIVTAVDPAALDLGIEYAILDLLPGWMAPVFVFGVIINTIAINGMTTYTASMAFQSIGVPIRRIPSAVVIGVLGMLFTLYLVLNSNLIDAVNLMLQLLILISAPTIAVYAVDILLRRNRYHGADLFEETESGPFWFTRGYGVRGLVSVCAGVVSGYLFITTDKVPGPISAAMGYIDLSVPVAILVPAILYTILCGKDVKAYADAQLTRTGAIRAVTAELGSADGLDEQREDPLTF